MSESSCSSSSDPSHPQPDKPTGGAAAERQNKEAEQQLEGLKEDAGTDEKIVGGSPGESPSPAEPTDDPSAPPRS